jgi:hypothetical protein
MDIQAVRNHISFLKKLGLFPAFTKKFCILFKHFSILVPIIPSDSVPSKSHSLYSFTNCCKRTHIRIHRPKVNVLHRDALRLLYIFVEGSSPLPDGDTSGAAAIFKGEARLYAIDFWMRYPDYLADELLNVFEQKREQRHLDAAKEIFKAEEPDIRRFPMIRWKFGAYERLDDTLAILTSRKLVTITGKKAGTRVLETDFLIMPSAFTLAKQIVIEFPELSWYSKRARLTAELAGDRGSKALKDHQHKQIEYHETKLGGTIPPITFRVQERLLSLIRTSASAGEQYETDYKEN